jgi:hypothetical protein
VNLALAIAAALLACIAIAHSYLGERYILIRLLSSTLLRINH